LIGFGQATYRQRSAETSLLLGQLFERLREEGFAMSFTMEDFKRQYIKEHFSQLTPDEQREALERLSPEHRREVLQVAQLTPHEQREALERLSPEHRREVLQSLPPEERLAGLSAEQIRQYLDRLTAEHPAPARRPRRKKS
jgi:Mg/Co/Ni transporter MgtE